MGIERREGAKQRQCLYVVVEGVFGHNILGFAPRRSIIQQFFNDSSAARKKFMIGLRNSHNERRLSPAEGHLSLLSFIFFIGF